MKSINKNIFFGFLVWLIPFAISFAFVSPSGELKIDKIFFKTIMIIAGTFIGVSLIVKYFKTVENNLLKEGIFLGLSWLLINWILDFFVVIPMANISYPTYFTEIGLRYLNFPIISIGIAYLLKYKHIENEKN